MATIKFKVGSEYIKNLEDIITFRKDIIGVAVYGGAGVVADEIQTQIQNIPTDERYGTTSDPVSGPKKGQVQALSNSLGIAPMQDNGRGFLNVKIGWDGYNHIKTERWPKGQPNQMVARSIERGTSYMKANLFVKKAVSKSRKKAVEIMGVALDREIEKRMKG